MNDLVKRLREWKVDTLFGPTPVVLALEAADRIEALEAAVNRFPDTLRAERDYEARNWARRVDGLTAQLRETDARYMALIKQVADGVAMQPRTVVLHTNADRIEADRI